jgi:hypothetical protein
MTVDVMNMHRRVMCENTDNTLFLIEDMDVRRKGAREMARPVLNEIE